MKLKFIPRFTGNRNEWQKNVFWKWKKERNFYFIFSCFAGSFEWNLLRIINTTQWYWMYMYRQEKMKVQRKYFQPKKRNRHGWEMRMKCEWCCWMELKVKKKEKRKFECGLNNDEKNIEKESKGDVTRGKFHYKEMALRWNWIELN